jgi:CheY-like chemotaxis protein/HPt (histidine-containing phosphotransfer) domain-containing protein
MNNLDDNRKSTLSILVVDDDELNQRMMRLLLKREGHVVECVSNGLEAVNAVTSGTFDIILMDLQMPVMDGVEASRRIREWEAGRKHTFIVALTASYMPERGRELYDVGIDNYIAKPFDMDHLRHILQYSAVNDASRSSVPESAAAGSVPDIDYKAGIKRVGGDEETYKELLGDFILELPSKLENMRLCHVEKDKDGLYRAAHNLKGVSANLGALKLSEQALRLEKQVSAGYTDVIGSMIDDISAIMDNLRVSVSNYLA